VYVPTKIVNHIFLFWNELSAVTSSGRTSLSDVYKTVIELPELIEVNFFLHKEMVVSYHLKP
jgi:hypothetical protein